MTTTNWIDIAFIATLAAWGALYLHRTLATRHDHCSITVTKPGLAQGSVTVTGMNAQDALRALDNTFTLARHDAHERELQRIDRQRTRDHHHAAAQARARG